MRLDNFSLEATLRTSSEFSDLAIRAQTCSAVNVAWLNGDDDNDRLRVARRIDDAGLLPVPIIAARRLTSQNHLFDLTEKFRFSGAHDRFMLVGGDPSISEGPFPTATDVLNSDWISKYQIKTISLPGFPGGNAVNGYRSDVGAIAEKISLVQSKGSEAEITTQLEFNPEQIVRWVHQLRDEGVNQLIRIGVPGPAKRDLLLKFARSFGISTRKLDQVSHTENGILRFSRLLDLFSDAFSRRNAGNLAIHLYPFGGVNSAVEWIEACEQSGYNKSNTPEATSG